MSEIDRALAQLELNRLPWEKISVWWWAVPLGDLRQAVAEAEDPRHDIVAFCRAHPEDGRLVLLTKDSIQFCEEGA